MTFSESPREMDSPTAVEDTAPPAEPAAEAHGVTADGHHLHYPEQQLTVIQARPSWQIVDIGEIWRFRELLYFLVWRDVKVRYKQTVLGAAWAILQPTAQMVVFSIFFGRMAEVATDSIPYPLFAFAGLLPWMFFQNSVTNASQSVIGNQNLITKVYFPRLFIPASAIGAALVDFGIACLMLVLLMAWYRTAPTAMILLAPFLALGLAAAAFGVGTLLSALTVAYRDFRYVVPWMVQLWMFATPTVYMDASVTGPRWQLVLPLNPAYGLINAFRSVTLGHSLDWYALGVSLAVTAVLVVTSCLYFRRVERTFADII